MSAARRRGQTQPMSPRAVTSRPIIVAALIGLTIAALGIPSACGGDDDSSKGAATTTAPEPNVAKSEDPPKGGAAPGPTDEELQQDVREQEREREEDRKFDESFRESPFDKLVNKLPIREPPLYVEQYITTTGSHTIYTAVDRKRFLCDLNARQRGKAVAGFYRSADRVFRSGGVNDFVQVVTPATPTREELPALATARKGSVSLTKLGRDSDGC